MSGFYFLAYTFPADTPREDVFDAMSAVAESDTGIIGAKIREKPIPLPELPALRTEAFYINDWSPETTVAQLQEKLKLVNRHFVSLQGLTKAFIVELYYCNHAEARTLDRC